MRKAEIKRETKETNISLSLIIEGSGKSKLDTGVGFLDHMLDLFAKHGRFDLSISCKGDTDVDDHHSVEDIGICLGQAFAQALGDKRGIKRYADISLPMDEALMLCAVDISGRGFLGYNVEVPTEKVGSLDTQLIEEFFSAFTREGGITLHFKELAGKNSHHIIEACFKALGRTMRAACEIDPAFADEIPSSKGLI